MNRTLIIFSKAPVAGRAKTRLARKLGVGRSGAILRAMTRRVIAEASRGPWRTVLAVDPPSAMRGYATTWPIRVTRMKQARGDLGRRMAAAMALAPTGPVIIIGADSPTLRAGDIARAFRLLAGHDAVFGPSEDGGFWLVGLARRRGAPRPFRNVRWSSVHALDDTIATLPTAFSIGMNRPLRDVDEADDLVALGPRTLFRSARHHASGAADGAPSGGGRTGPRRPLTADPQQPTIAGVDMIPCEVPA